MIGDERGISCRAGGITQAISRIVVSMAYGSGKRLAQYVEAIVGLLTVDLMKQLRDPFRLSSVGMHLAIGFLIARSLWLYLTISLSSPQVILS